jgi:hypothetical protein
MVAIQTINLVEVEGQGLYTFEAYCELRLQMSTGDFHTHKHTIVTVDASLEYIDLDDSGEFILINEDTDCGPKDEDVGRDHWRIDGQD